jgi:AcrR family transcriptional regulator
VKEKQAAPKPTESARKRQILEAALATFLRFGFRKTSMDDVAQAAELSRQALYLHFATKEELFCAALSHYLQGALRDATECLSAPDVPLRQRLLGALDAWVGRVVGISGENISDLHEASVRHGGAAMADYDASFVKALTQSLRQQGVPNGHKAAGLSARQIAETLLLVARGLKYDVTSRKDFLERLKPSLRLICLPWESMPPESP